MLLLVLISSICFIGGEALTCYQCQNVSDPSQCRIKVNCSYTEHCYVESNYDSSVDADRYTVGCQKLDTCMINDPRITRRIKRNAKADGDKVERHKRTSSCYKCCSTDDCNLSLCRPIVPTSSEMYVRLVNGNSPYEGLVQVFRGDSWGTICDNGWTASEAQVICRMLGYKSDGATAMPGGVYNTDPGSQIYMDWVSCVGNEHSLAHCKINTVISANCTHRKDAGVQCISVTPEDGGVIFLLDTQYKMFLRMNLRTQSYSTIPTLPIYTPGTFDYDPSQGRIYFTETKFQQILSMKYDGSDIRIIKQLIINSQVDTVVRVDTVKIDPINHILFYTGDFQDGIVSMNIDGSNSIDVVKARIGRPNSLALDYYNKTMYWTDRGYHPKIESANYDGSNRTTLTTSNLIWPNSIAIDLNENMLYFVDGGMGTIEKMDFHGNNRKTIYSDSSTHYYAMDLFGDFIYFTDWGQNEPMRINKDGTGLSHIGAPSFVQLAQIRVYDQSTTLSDIVTPSPLYFDPTHMFIRLVGLEDSSTGRVEIYANKQWGTICDSYWDDTNAAVVCSMLGFNRTRARIPNSNIQRSGFGMISLKDVDCIGSESHIAYCMTVTPDNWGVQSCHHSDDATVMCDPQVMHKDTMLDNFIVFCEVSSNQLIRMDLNTFSYTSIHLSNFAYSPPHLAVTFDPIGQLIYFSEVGIVGSQIKNTGHRGDVIHTLPYTVGGSVIYGLAVDKNQDVMFYTDAGNRRVVRLSPDGNNVRSLTSDLEKPTGIALDKRNHVVYWADAGAKPKIQSSHYDWSNRSTIASVGLIHPIGVAVDPVNRLVYFCDNGTHTIEVMNTDGSNRKVLFTDYSSHFFGLTITSQYIFYSDWNKRNIYRLNRDGTNHMPAGPPEFLQVNGIYAYESSFS